ncbi:hypothetical protein WJX81_005760 [Elliptochloris bilobata]|uniref:Very-long-chain (3R)-3-hydroxyacyl-CoA dehydratase n=1 Tax=Elliptochloris bilobata TaxID=381761 RepID=A0AAW1QUK4_9CHLO
MGMGSLRTPYLITYNLAQLLGWSAVICQTAVALARTGSPGSVYAAAGPAVRLCQGLAVLETVHISAGVVKGSVALSFLQWFGRFNVLFLVLHSIPELWAHWALPVMFLSWALADVVRYLWYALSLAGSPPPLLTWLRYTMFIALYPLGILLGEMPLYAAGLPYLRERRLYSLALPNALNFSFDYHRACQAALSAILPLSGTYLYLYLLRQRRKRLSSGAGGKRA